MEIFHLVYFVYYFSFSLKIKDLCVFVAATLQDPLSCAACKWLMEPLNHTRLRGRRQSRRHVPHVEPVHKSSCCCLSVWCFGVLGERRLVFVKLDRCLCCVNIGALQLHTPSTSHVHTHTARSPLLFIHCQAAAFKLIPRLRPPGHDTCWNETSGDFFFPTQTINGSNLECCKQASPSAHLKYIFFSPGFHFKDKQNSKDYKSGVLCFCWTEPGSGVASPHFLWLYRQNISATILNP